MWNAFKHISVSSRKNKMRNKERVRKYGEVFTPEWVVKKMCDTLEEEAGKDIWIGNGLEPACGNGNFLVEIAKRKLKCGLTPEKAARTTFGIDILPDNVEESIERLLEILPGTREILEKNIVCGNFLTKLTSDGEKIWFLDDTDEGKDN